MSTFLKFKQKLSHFKFTYSRNNFLSVAFLVLFFALFYSHPASAFGEDTLKDLIVFLLKIVLKFVTVMLSIAETLFTWIISPAIMKTILENGVIYITWRAVRDVFNVVFIMVLLFSAFATIFQVSKYNYKNTLLNLVLMALLVNFSYPIARVIIDASNMIMFGFLQTNNGLTSFVSIIDASGIAKITTTSSPDPLYLLSAIIFTFILAVTLLVIAVLLVIRTMSLAIYIIFSPIAFVGPILPGTKMASAGSSWWSDFMKNCFAGPIMIFMLYIASTLMTATMELGKKTGTLDKLAKANLASNAGSAMSATELNALQELILTASFFALPIIVLWLGIMEAQKSGIAGAGAVVGAGTKFIKSQLRRWSSAGFIQDTHKAYSARRSRAKEDSWSNKLGGKIGSQQDRLRGTMPGGTDARLRYQADQAAKVEKEAKRNAMAGADPEDLKKLAASSNKFESAAAIMELAAQKLATGAQLESVRKEFGNDSQVTKQLENKMKTYAPQAVYRDKDGNLDEAKAARYMSGPGFNADNLGAEALGDKQLMRLGIKSGAITNKHIDKHMKDGSDEAKSNVKKSLASLAGEGEFDGTAIANFNTEKGTIETAISTAATSGTQEERDALDIRLKNVNAQIKASTNIQTAHLSHLGRFHDSIKNTTSDKKTKGTIIAGLNKDSASGISEATMTDTNNIDLFAEHLNSGNTKDILQNMKSRAGAIAIGQRLNGNDGTGFTATTVNGRASQRIARTDPHLSAM